MNSGWAVAAALALAGCAQDGGTTSGMATGGVVAAGPAAPVYRPKVDLASAPNGGADYEKHVAQCNSYVAQDTQQKSSGAAMSSTVETLATGVAQMWSGGLSGGNVASAMGSAAATGGATMLQQQAVQKAQAQAPAPAPASVAPAGVDFIRTCMKSYGYKVTE
jgi:hypothetical protein